jgi:hypothetical protein
MSASDPSARVVEQRIRNRLIEYLEMLIAYEAGPCTYDLNEVINQWEDWNPTPHSQACQFPAPTYTGSEAALLSLVAEAWENLCVATPQNISSLSEVIRAPQWRSLITAADSALHELRSRGKLSEEPEVESGKSAA